MPLNQAPFAVWAPRLMGEPAVLFCFLFLYLAAAGAGPWSVDATRERGERALTHPRSIA